MKNQDLENTYVIGDVHGCYHTLMKLLDKLPKDARLIFVGDLCDRGLYTKDVIEFVIQNNYECILGNHEHYMLDNILKCIADPSIENRYITHDYMGGVETIQSYENSMGILHKHLDWIKTLPTYIDVENFFISHAFCIPYYNRRDEKEKAHAMLVNRLSDEEEWSWDWEDGWREYNIVNVYGHEHSKEIIEGKNFFGIDTGCVYGGKLSALNLGTLEITQQSLDKKDITN